MSVFLLNHGAVADLNLNAMTLACQKGCLRIVRKLFETGDIDINCANMEMWMMEYYPLHMAVISGSFEVVAFLLLHGADVTVTDRRNQTPQQIALKYGYLDIVYLLNEFAYLALPVCRLV